MYVTAGFTEGFPPTSPPHQMTEYIVCNFPLEDETVHRTYMDCNQSMITPKYLTRDHNYWGGSTCVSLPVVLMVVSGFITAAVWAQRMKWNGSKSHKSIPSGQCQNTPMLSGWALRVDVLEVSTRGTRRKWSIISRVATQVHWCLNIRLHHWPSPDLQSQLSICDLSRSCVKRTMDKAPFLSH